MRHAVIHGNCCGVCWAWCPGPCIAGLRFDGLKQVKSSREQV